MSIDRIRLLFEPRELGNDEITSIWERVDLSGRPSAWSTRYRPARVAVVMLAAIMLMVGIAGASHLRILDGIAGAIFHQASAPREAVVPPLSGRERRLLEEDCASLSFEERMERADRNVGQKRFPNYDDRQRAFYDAMALCEGEFIGEGDFLVKGPKPAGVRISITSDSTNGKVDEG